MTRRRSLRVREGTPDLLELLRREDRITPDELQLAEARCSEADMRPARGLVDAGVLDEGELTAFIEKQAGLWPAHGDELAGVDMPPGLTPHQAWAFDVVVVDLTRDAVTVAAFDPFDRWVFDVIRAQYGVPVEVRWVPSLAAVRFALAACAFTYRDRVEWMDQGFGDALVDIEERFGAPHAEELFRLAERCAPALAWATRAGDEHLAWVTFSLGHGDWDGARALNLGILDDEARALRGVLDLERLLRAQRPPLGPVVDEAFAALAGHAVVRTQDEMVALTSTSHRVSASPEALELWRAPHLDGGEWVFFANDEGRRAFLEVRVDRGYDVAFETVARGALP